MISSLPHNRIKAVLLVLLVLITVQSLWTQDSIILSDNSIEARFDEARRYKNTNTIDLALEVLDKAAEIAEKNEDEKGLVECYHKFALLYFELGKRENTIFYWDRATVLLKNLEFPYGHAVHKYIEAMLLYDSGNNFQAIFMLNEARQLNNDRNLLNNIHLLEANIYLTIEKYDSATTIFNSLLINTDIYESKYLTTKSLLGLAKLHSKTENFEQSLENAKEALAIAEENGFSKGDIRSQ